MKIEFDDHSYIECKKSNEPDKIILTICAKDHSDKLKKVSNSVEITIDEFNKLISEVLESITND